MAIVIHSEAKMLQMLLESHHRRQRRSGGITVSVLAHAAMITGAVVATARGARRTKDDSAATPVTYVAPRNPAPIPHRVAPELRVNVPAPLARPLLIAPIEIPSVLPAIDPGAAVTDERLFDGRGAAGTRGVVETGGSSPNGEVYMAPLVEKAVSALRGNPVPAYPEALRRAQVEGSVLANFVVDTSGHVEPGSITFPTATHRLFEGAVRDALTRSRYLPAEGGGRKVRQLVEQRFEFRRSARE